MNSDSGSAPGLTLQVASTVTDLPALAAFRIWVDLARQGHPGEVTVRIVDEAESAQLNRQFRHQQGPTNVLSFSATEPDMTLPPDMDPELGDLAICAPLVIRQAAEQNKAVGAHWAHLTLHGVLHLCGFDHQTEADQQQMEALEINLLRQIGIGNPYVIDSLTVAGETT